MFVLTLQYFFFFYLSSFFKDLQDLQHFLSLCLVKMIFFLSLSSQFLLFTPLLFEESTEPIGPIASYSYTVFDCFLEIMPPKGTKVCSYYSIFLLFFLSSLFKDLQDLQLFFQSMFSQKDLSFSKTQISVFFFLPLFFLKNIQDLQDLQHLTVI